MKLNEIISPLSTFVGKRLKKVNCRLFEKKCFSQHSEDGVIQSLFDLIGTTNKYFVEFGVEDGKECNTRYMREKHGWQGLMMDGCYENLAINLRREFVTKENVNELFRKYKVPHEFDLLSIDIDYNDFYVWQALKYLPRVVVIEYNASHLPDEDKIVKYSPNYMWDKTNYFGASILALFKLGRNKGYSLVYAERVGVNLFFLRDDVLKEFHKTRRIFLNFNNVTKIYRLPRYGNGPSGGHEPDPLAREYISSKEVL